MLNLKLSCKRADHKNQDIQFICVNKECISQRLACIDCLKQFHDQHVKDTIDQNQFASWKQDCEKITDRIVSAVSENQKITLKFQKIIDYQIKDTNLDTLTTEQAKQFINRVIKLKNLSPELIEDLNQMSLTMKLILSKFKSKKESIFEQNMITYGSKVYDKQPGTFSMIKLKKQEWPSKKSHVNFSFSMENQGFLIQTKYDGKLVQLYSGFCLCQPPIPSEHTGETSFAFKIIQMEKSNVVFLGVGTKSISETKTFQINFFPGYYICNQGNIVCNNYFQKVEGQKQPFTFQQDDTIIVNVDNSKNRIVWIKKGTNENYTLKIQNSRDFYPSVGQLEFTNSIFSPVLVCIVDD